MPKQSSTHSSPPEIDLLAHDLRNPLGAIIGYSDVLIETSEGEGLSERQRKLITRIRSTGERILEMVNNYQELLAIKKPQATLANTTLIDLCAMIDTIVDTVRIPIDLSINFKRPAMPALVAIPRAALDRIITNLLMNAIKYTRSAGSVSISVFTNTERTELTVHNTPAEIPASDLEHVFDSFFRCESAKDIAGSGLGLYIVKELVERFGGSISIISPKNEGVTAKVTFPNNQNL